MRHVPEGTIRRLVDEPLAIADGDADHISGCARCRARCELVNGDAAQVAAFFSRPQPVPDIDGAWRRFRAAPSVPSSSGRALQHFRARRSWRLVGRPLPSTAALAACTLLVAGAAAATVLTTLSGPAPTAPVQAVSTDFQAIADTAGIEGSGVIGGFPTPSGSLRLAFGVLRWTSAGRARSVASMAAASEATGLLLRLPVVLPAGVGALGHILVHPQVTATISFGAGAGAGLAGTSLHVTAGPAVLVEYGSSLGSLGIPSLATFAMAATERHLGGGDLGRAGGLPPLASRSPGRSGTRGQAARRPRHEPARAGGSRREPGRRERFTRDPRLRGLRSRPRV